MKNIATIISLVFCGFGLGHTLHANNIYVSNLIFTGATDSTVQVQFDLSWDNSWRIGTGPANWDAAWVFIKYSAVGGSGPWLHATLDANGHNAPSGSVITQSSDGKGVFVYRNANGSGTNNWPGVQLKWRFGFDGLSDIDSTVVQVFAMEMVYIPEGAFAVGDGNPNYASFVVTTINTPDATVAPSGSGNLGGQAGGYPTAETPPTQSNWPNGYNDFYIMKYEASEEQWVAFFNTLTLQQMSNRDITGSLGKNSDGVVHRNTVGWAIGFATTQVPDRACNFLKFPDAAAFLDWACLRPMTELEFEKACRGAEVLPVFQEFVWGNNGAHNQGYSLSNEDTPSESIFNPSGQVSTGNAIYGATNTGNINGPLRCGIFAASNGIPARSLSGGTYYGVMEMGGNLFEYVATIHSGSTYTGTHGDGILTGGGEATNSDWPFAPSNLLTIKGGAWGEDINWLRTSMRGFPFGVPGWYHPGSQVFFGARGVRTAP